MPMAIKMGMIKQIPLGLVPDFLYVCNSTAAVFAPDPLDCRQ
jgi:hypothetical protein